MFNLRSTLRLATSARTDAARPSRGMLGLARPRVALVVALLGVALWAGLVAANAANAANAAAGRAAAPGDPAPPIPALPVIAYVAPGEGGTDIWIYRPGGGKPTNITNTPGVSEGAPAWSPGGARIAFVRPGNGRTERQQIWVMGAGGEAPHAVAADSSKELIDPTWSPDGAKIAFSRGIGATWGIWAVNADGTGLHNVAEQANTRMLRPDWSPTGKQKIVFERHAGLGRGEIWVIDSDGSGAEQLAGGRRFDDFLDPTWSADGQQIAFNGNPNGAIGGILVMKASPSAPWHQLTGGDTNAYDHQAAWSTTGNQILFSRYRSPTSTRIYAIDAADGSQEQFVVEGSDPAPRPSPTLAELVDAKDRPAIRKLLSSHSIAEINAEVAGLDNDHRHRLAEVVLDFDAFSLPQLRRRDQLLTAMRAALNQHQLGFYAEVWSYTRLETRPGGGGEFYCDSARVVLGLDTFADPVVLRNTLLHEFFHSFDCHEGGPVGALDEGAAIWVFKEAFGSTGPAQNWAEATYGTKLWYRDLAGNPGYPLNAPVSPTGKLMEQYRYLSVHDGSRLPWSSQEKLTHCYGTYWEPIDRAQPYEEYLRKAEAATNAMLADTHCSTG